MNITGEETVHLYWSRLKRLDNDLEIVTMLSQLKSLYVSVVCNQTKCDNTYVCLGNIKEIVHDIELRLTKTQDSFSLAGHVCPENLINHFEYEDFMHRAFQLDSKEYHLDSLLFQSRIDTEKKIIPDIVHVLFLLELLLIKKNINTAILRFGQLNLTVMESLKIEVMKNLLFSATTCNDFLSLLKFGLDATERFKQ